MRDANQMTRQYMDRILIEERLIDSTVATTTFELWGKTYTTPIMTPAFSHLNSFGPGRDNGLVEYSKAMQEIGAVNWIGMGENDAIGEVLATGADTIRIIKPYADKAKVIDQIQYATAHGAIAVGVDTDHILGSDGKYDLVVGERMREQTMDDLREYMALTNLPFVIKGVLSVTDALKCAELGIQGIVVSHHHGRLPFAIPPLMVLPQIKEALADHPEVKIFVDCSIDTGADAFKALALGADAVSVGRAMLPSLEKDGVEGVKKFFDGMNRELAYIMAFTGASNLSEIKKDVLWDSLTGKPLS